MDRRARDRARGIAEDINKAFANEEEIASADADELATLFLQLDAWCTGLEGALRQRARGHDSNCPAVPRLMPDRVTMAASGGCNCGQDRAAAVLAGKGSRD